MKATQIGVTEVGNTWILFTIAVSPAAMMAVFPTNDLAVGHSKQKLSPSIEETPCLRDKVAARRVRDGENTILTKAFPGGFLWMSGSNSGANFRSKSVKNIFLDDIDGFEIIPGEGSPLELAKRRTDSYGDRRKIFYNSTPTVKGASMIERVFNDSDQRYFHVPCPRCGAFQRLQWGGADADFGIKFSRDDAGRVIDVWYVCEGCRGRIDESEKTAMMEAGRWVSTVPERERRGYQLSSLYSPVGWVSWKQIVTEFLSAKGNTETMRAWVNTRLGEPYEEKGDQPEWLELKARAEPYRLLTAPRGVRVVTAGVDVMDTFLSVVVYGWGGAEECYLMYAGEIFGDPTEESVWKSLDEQLLNRKWEIEGGGQTNIVSMAIDSGGHAAQEVYRYCRVRSPVVMAVRGASQPNRPVLSMPNTVDVTYMGQKFPGGVQLWTLGTEVIKATIYSHLRLKDRGPGRFHFPIGMPDSFYQELTAEKRVTRLHKGFPRAEWIQIKRKNHALDATVYAYAAAVRVHAHLIPADDPTKSTSPAAPARPPESRGRQQITQGGRSSWMGTRKGWIR